MILATVTSFFYCFRKQIKWYCISSRRCVCVSYRETS